MTIWTEKYRPKSLEDYLGNNGNVNSIKKWMSDFKSNKDVSNSILIYGPPGTGKTSLANIILNTYNYDMVVFEERFNVIMIQSGRIGLLHAR